MRRLVSHSKYRAQPTIVDGIRFHSKREAARYQELRLLELAGEIRELQLQPKFPLYAPERGSSKPAQIGVYIADFRYREGPRGLLRVEDVKGFDVPLGKWKRKHAEIQYGIDIQVVR